MLGGSPLSGPMKKLFPLFSTYPQFVFIYYEKEDVCKKPDPNIFKIGRVTHVFRNWPISDQFFKNLGQFLGSTNKKRLNPLKKLTFTCFDILVNKPSLSLFSE
jgi:hypothetical protein